MRSFYHPKQMFRGMLQSSKCCCRFPSKALKPLLGLLQSMQWWVPFQGFISLTSLLHMVTRQPCWLHTKFVHGKFTEFFWSVLAAGYMGAQARLHGNGQIFWIASARITPCTKGGCYLSFRECITDVALEFFWWVMITIVFISSVFPLCIISERHVLGGESQRHWADLLKRNLLPSKDTCRWLLATHLQHGKDHCFLLRCPTRSLASDQPECALCLC